MDLVKRIGATCRQHYEKIILVLVLLLMGIAVVIIFQQSQEERERIRKIPVGFDTRKVKGVKPVDLQPIEKAIEAAANPPVVALSGNHNLFNPVRWLEYPGGRRTKVQTGEEVGPAKMQIVEIRPLSLSIALERTLISGTGDQKIVTGYQTVVTNDLLAGARRKLTQFMGVGDTNKQVFAITSVKGDAETPSELAGRLKDSGQTFTFSKDKPFVRVVGYEADLKYLVTGAMSPNRRKDSEVVIEGDKYKIVDITENSVVLSDQSNGKRYSVGKSTPQP